jgi:hypothetical protein
LLKIILDGCHESGLVSIFVQNRAPKNRKKCLII